MRNLVLLTLFLLPIGCGFSGYGVRHVEHIAPVEHRVKQGETIWDISRHYGVNDRTIMRLNGIRDATTVVPGTVLLVGYGNRPELRNAYTQSAKRPIALAPRANGKRRLALPIRAGKLVSRFGPRKRSFHDGLDISARSGTPVYAAHTGSVTYAGSRLRGYGKLVIIQGNDGLITVYAHNRKLLVRKGQRVKLGDKIAEVGSTGRSSGPHLHFEVRMRDRRGRLVAIDPLPILRASGQKPRFRVNESLSPLLAKR